MRIVIVLNEPPLPFGGAAARWYYVLTKGLVGRHHQVKVFYAAPTIESMDKVRSHFPSPEYDVRGFPVEKMNWFQSKLLSFRRPVVGTHHADDGRDRRCGSLLVWIEAGVDSGSQACAAPKNRYAGLRATPLKTRLAQTQALR